jgi:hypothetical protein
MKDLLDKLSSYNVFNYLLPGILFAVFASRLTIYTLIQHDIVLGIFVYYFLGLVISRFGSLIIEPLFKKTGFVEFAPYADFVSASKKDDAINILSEANNMYRTLCSVFILLLLLLGYQWLQLHIPGLGQWNPYIATVLLILMFLLSYRKQTDYVKKRIKANKS